MLGDLGGTSQVLQSVLTTDAEANAMERMEKRRRVEEDSIIGCGLGGMKLRGGGVL